MWIFDTILKNCNRCGMLGSRAAVIQPDRLATLKGFFRELSSEEERSLHFFGSDLIQS
jgi:hypothetical protein